MENLVSSWAILYSKLWGTGVRAGVVSRIWNSQLKQKLENQVWLLPGL